MARLTNDERKVSQAQRQYNDDIDKYQVIVSELSDNITEICDLLLGNSLCWPQSKYELSVQQIVALKDQRSFWLASIKDAEKVLAFINNGLRKAYNESKNDGTATGTDSKMPKLAVFSSIAKA